MIAVSSFRPMDKDDEVTRNQIEAAKTWWDVFDQIVYLGDFDARISAEHVSFVSTEGKPTIREVASMCVKQPSWSCVINADIRLTSTFRQVQPLLERKCARAAASWRFQFDPVNESPPTGVKEDWGVDIFICKQDIWQAVERTVPDYFRIGEILWDTWMVGFLATVAWNNWYDITPTRTVFHPRHTVRNGTFSPTPEMHDEYVRAARWPTKVIAL